MQYTICYLGSDEVFYQELVDYYSYMCSKKSSLEFVYKSNDITTKEGITDFLQECDEEIPHLVFIDFYNLIDDREMIDRIAHMMLILKKSYYFGTIPFVGLFKSKEELLANGFLFSCGMCYSYIKRDNTEGTVFRDSAFIGFDIELRFESYAIASDIDLFHKLGAIGIVNRMGIDDIEIETDIVPMRDVNLEVEFNFFDDFNLTEFEILGKNKGEKVFDHSFSYKLKIPYGNKWVNEPGSIYEDTMDTWFENYADKFKKNNDVIFILDDDQLTPVELYKLSLSCNYRIERRSYSQNPQDTLNKLRPKMIFINMFEEDSSVGGDIPANDTNVLFQIIVAIKSIPGYMPFIFVFNAPSVSNALQKAYGYTSLLAYRGGIELTIIDKIIQVHQNKKINELDKSIKYYFSLNDNKAKALVKEDVLITSITEHEITFASKNEYPCFMVFQLDVPFDAFITIVPPSHELKFIKNNFHYMGFIHGVNETDLAYLRKFVNKIIFEPLEEFVRIEVEDDEHEEVEENLAQFDLRHEDEVSRREEEITDEEDLENQEVDKKKRVRRKRAKRGAFGGKSKL